MKKLVLLISSLIITIGLCSCGGESGLFAKPSPTPIPMLDPTQILTSDDVYEGVGYDYVPVLDGEVKTEGNTKSAIYLSNPKGLGDSVEIKITQYNEAYSINDIYQQFLSNKEKRSDITEVTELGETAYIAFPTIHIFDRGCIIEVTAGSGSDENQQNTLIFMAKKAVDKFEQLMPAPTVE